LLGRAGARDANAVTSRRPSSLQVDAILALAEAIDEVELAGNERTRSAGLNVAVEVRVDVAADDIDDFTEDIDALLPDVKGLGSRAGAGIACAGEGGFAGDDELCELAGGGEAAEDGLVTDDDELDEIPLGPGDDLSDLFCGTGAAALVDE
jgi:hypothetical protein